MNLSSCDLHSVRKPVTIRVRRITRVYLFFDTLFNLYFKKLLLEIKESVTRLTSNLLRNPARNQIILVIKYCTFSRELSFKLHYD